MKLPKIIREPSSHGDRSSAVLIKTLGREVTAPPPDVIPPISCVGATSYLTLSVRTPEGDNATMFTAKILVDGIDRGYHDIDGWNNIYLDDGFFLGVYIDSSGHCGISCYKNRPDNIPMRFEFLPTEDMSNANIAGILDENPTAVYDSVNRSVKVCFIAEETPQ